MSRSLARGPLYLTGVVMVVLLSWMDAPYLLVQASYVVRDLFGARAFHAVAEPTAREAELFARVRAIRRFGINELGLSQTRAYTRYRRIDRQALVWVVSGVEEFAWTRYQWRYPLLGRLPYRGYYRERDAAAEAARLRQAGYDALYRRVTAFSFLGFLPDPLYSFALERSYSSLADLILHEMTHAALFVRGQGSFNENLASFVGAEGSRQFMAATFGADSVEYREMDARRSDQETFRNLMLELRAELEAFYDRLPDDAPGTEAELQKQVIFRQFQQRVQSDYESLFTTDVFLWLTDQELNNALVDLYVTYSAEQDVFKELLAARGGSIPELLEDLRSIRSDIAHRGLTAVRELPR